MKELDIFLIDKLTEIVLTRARQIIVSIGVGDSFTVLSRHAQNFALNYHASDTRPGICTWAKTSNCNVFEGIPVDFIKQFPDIPVAIVVVNDARADWTVLNFFLDRLVSGGMIFIGRDIFSKWTKADDVTKRPEMQVITWPCVDGYELIMVMKN